MRTIFLSAFALVSLGFRPAPLPTPAAAPMPVTAPTAAPAPEAILGRWLTADKAGIVEITVSGGTFSGKLTGPATTGRVDAKNADAALRKRPLLGLPLLQGFRFEDGAWEDGTVYDPNNGKTYSCILRLKSANVLEVRGYVGISLLGRTDTWTRVL